MISPRIEKRSGMETAPFFGDLPGYGKIKRIGNAIKTLAQAIICVKSLQQKPTGLTYGEQPKNET